MNANMLRHFFDYHFSENRILWDRQMMALSQAQFTQHIPYSLGSVRNHFVHLMSVDDVWFSALSGGEFPGDLNPDNFADRSVLRAHWDGVESRMREYLQALRDPMLFDKPLDGEDENLSVWQVLLHIVNHGTDHRAQVLRALHDLGAATTAQDYIFYVYDHP